MSAKQKTQFDAEDDFDYLVALAVVICLNFGPICTKITV